MDLKLNNCLHVLLCNRKLWNGLAVLALMGAPGHIMMNGCAVVWCGGHMLWANQ